MSERKGLEVNWAQTIGGALAAMSSAVLLSTFGVAGTIIGAAVGSVVLTIGGAVYSHYLALSRERMAMATRAAVLARATREQGAGRGGVAATTRQQPPVEADGSAQRPDRLEEEVDEARAEAADSVGWREAARDLPWRRILVASAVIFVLAMGAIVAFELATGRPVSSYTGGSGRDGPRTSIPFGGLGGDAEPAPEQEAPAPGGSRRGDRDVPPLRMETPPPDEEPGAPATTQPQPTAESTTEEPTEEPTTEAPEPSTTAPEPTTAPPEEPEPSAPASPTP